MQKKSVVLYFVKDPVPGKVKTRLAKSIGPEAAANHYQDLAYHNYQQILTLEKNNVDVWVTYDPPESLDSIKEWLKDSSHYIAQKGVTLEERLIQSFEDAFKGGASQVFALGSDTLNLEPSWILEGVKALENHDVVLGPAEDGGYYLIGCKKLNQDIFREINWSTAFVLKQTVRKIEKNKLSYYLLPVTSDLDEASELHLIKK